MLFTKLTFLDTDKRPLGNSVATKSKQEALRILQSTKNWKFVQIRQETERGYSPLTPNVHDKISPDAAPDVIKQLPQTEAEYERRNGRIIPKIEQDKEQEALARASEQEDMKEFSTKRCWTPYFVTLNSEGDQSPISYDAVSLLGLNISWMGLRCGPGSPSWYFPIIRTRRHYTENTISKFTPLTKDSWLFFDILTAYALVQDGLCSAEAPKENNVLDQRYPIDGSFVQSIQKELFAKYDRVRVQDLIDLLQKRSPASLANVLVRYEETKAAADAADAAHASEGSKVLDIPDDSTSDENTKSTSTKTPVSLVSIGEWFTSTTLSCPSVGSQKALTQTVPTNNLHLVSGDWQEITNKNEACKVETSLSPVKVLGTALGLGVMVAGLGLLIKK